MAEIEISKIKPFIFISGILSLVLPWVYRINFLGIYFTVQFVSLIIVDLMYFGLFYLVGLCLNFVFFKYDGHLNYFIGYLSLCLVIIGAIGYYATLYSIISQIENNLDKEIEIVLGPGFYFILLTIFFICFEVYYLKFGTIKIKRYKKKIPTPELEEKPRKKERIKELDKKEWTRRDKIVVGVLLIFLLFFIGLLIYIFSYLGYF